jgi:hypothetical protein
MFSRVPVLSVHVIVLHGQTSRNNSRIRQLIREALSSLLHTTSLYVSMTIHRFVQIRLHKSRSCVMEHDILLQYLLRNFKKRQN